MSTHYIFFYGEKYPSILVSYAYAPYQFFCVLLNQCILGNFSCFLLSADFFSSKLTFGKNSFRNTIRMSNSFDPDPAQRFVGPDLVPNCLPRLSANKLVNKGFTLI